MRPITIAELHILAGRDERTVRRALAAAGLVELGRKGRAVLYDSAKALEAIYGTDDSARNRLDNARAELAEMDLATRRGELVERAIVANTWSGLVSSFRARMLAIPTKIAPQVAPPGKVQQAEDVIAAAVHEALAEVSGDGLPNAR